SRDRAGSAGADRRSRRGPRRRSPPAFEQAILPVISIRDASKRFAAPEGGVIHALRGVSLDVGDKEFITLLGPSGCGKTTLLRSISGFEDLDEGSIAI